MSQRLLVSLWLVNAQVSYHSRRKPSLKVNQRRSGSPKRKSLSPRVNVADVNLLLVDQRNIILTGYPLLQVKKAPLPQSARKASPLKQSRLPIKISSKPPVHFGLASKNLKTPTNATSKRVENSRIPISLGKRPVSTQKFANQPFSNSSKKGTPTQLVNSAKMVPLSPNLGKLTTPTISTIAKRRVSITPQQSVAKVKTWASVVKVSRPDYTTKVKTPKLVKTPAKLPMGNMKVSCGSRWDRNALVEKVFYHWRSAKIDWL